jgi:uncharacterized membrane protein YccC
VATNWEAWLYPISGADAASYAGIILTLVGFGITFYQLIKTKDAATAAAEAVEQLQQRLSKLDAVQGLATAQAQIRELKRMTRSRSPSDVHLLPERCETLRGILIEHKPRASIEDTKELVSLIVLLSNIETSSVNATRTGAAFDPLSFYSSLSEKLDLISDLLARLKKEDL